MLEPSPIQVFDISFLDQTIPKCLNFILICINNVHSQEEMIFTEYKYTGILNL